MHPEFPDEDIMALFEEKWTYEDIDKWIVCFDGASNALGHGVGAVLVSLDDQCIPGQAGTLLCDRGRARWETMVFQHQIVCREQRISTRDF